MDYTILLENFRQQIELRPEEEDTAKSLLSNHQFKRGEYLNYIGKVNKYTHFLTKGSVKVYYLDSNGHEHIIQLCIEGWWTSDFSSFITQSAGKLIVEALEYTETLAYSYENLQLLYEKVPKMERFYRLLIQRAYVAFQDRILQNLSMDAEERYQNFRKKYPLMDRQISQKNIASYLGMSPEFLSKIKKRLAIKERKKN